MRNATALFHLPATHPKNPPSCLGSKQIDFFASSVWIFSMAPRPGDVFDHVGCSIAVAIATAIAVAIVTAVVFAIAIAVVFAIACHGNMPCHGAMVPW